MSQPLDLDAIRERARLTLETGYAYLATVAEDVPALIAEVERLRSENERLLSAKPAARRCIHGQGIRNQCVLPSGHDGHHRFGTVYYESAVSHTEETPQ